MLAFVAEDNADYRELLRLLLERKGFTVQAFENGRELLEAIDLQHPPQVIIVDWLMPGINGLQVTHRVRHLTGSAKHAYILVITGSAEDQLIDEALRAGADDYVLKPYGTKLLEIKLNAAIRFATCFAQLQRCTLSGTSVATV